MTFDPLCVIARRNDEAIQRKNVDNLDNNQIFYIFLCKVWLFCVFLPPHLENLQIKQ